jgi:hypothetical protein
MIRKVSGNGDAYVDNNMFLLTMLLRNKDLGVDRDAYVNNDDFAITVIAVMQEASGNWRQVEKRILDGILGAEVYDSRMRPPVSTVARNFHVSEVCALSLVQGTVSTLYKKVVCYEYTVRGYIMRVPVSEISFNLLTVISVVDFL